LFGLLRENMSVLNLAHLLYFFIFILTTISSEIFFFTSELKAVFCTQTFHVILGADGSRAMSVFWKQAVRKAGICARLPCLPIQHHCPQAQEALALCGSFTGIFCSSLGLSLVVFLPFPHVLVHMEV
jgi:hypothetical protein